MKLKKENLMPAVVLSVICIVVALLLSLVNLITGPIIEEAQNAASSEALKEVLPGIGTHEEITVDDKYPSVITKAYKADIGYVFQATVTGKSSGLIIMCGISNDGKITGTKVIAEQETDDYDAKVFPNVEGTDGVYTGMNLESFEPYLVSGATLTSKAYSEAIKASLQAFAIAGGAEVDLRTPEQIIQDNCNAALGTADVTFTKWFATESVSGVDSVYESENGRVYVIGESFVAIKDGMVINDDASEENKAAALLADNIVATSSLTEVQKPEGASRMITKLSISASGNFVFELKTVGYEYGHGDLIIKLSISAEGKIIDCLTVSHGESKGYGDKCATEEYYESWRGVGSDGLVISSSPVNPSDPGAISGATQTTNGYQKAVKAAFTAFELLTEGGNN